jgi:hypothetical protein
MRFLKKTLQGLRLEFADYVLLTLLSLALMHLYPFRLIWVWVGCSDPVSA